MAAAALIKSKAPAGGAGEKKWKNAPLEKAHSEGDPNLSSRGRSRPQGQGGGAWTLEEVSQLPTRISMGGSLWGGEK